MGIPQRASFLVCVVTGFGASFWRGPSAHSPFLLCSSQTEFSPRTKRPISCTRTLQSRWLFLLSRDTMVCHRNGARWLVWWYCVAPLSLCSRVFIVYVCCCVWSTGTIFAYGQTSSGKTFTMMGGDRIHGVIPLAVDDVFQTIRNVGIESGFKTFQLFLVEWISLSDWGLLFCSSVQRRSSSWGFPTWKSTTRLWVIYSLTAARGNPWKCERQSM